MGPSEGAASTDRDAPHQIIIRIKKRKKFGEVFSTLF
jgi:hypothetical protein